MSHSIKGSPHTPLLQRFRSICGFSAVWVALIQPLHAEQKCGAIDPQSIQQPDLYYNFTSGDEPPLDQARISAFKQQLLGRWKGHSLALTCRGRENDLTEELENFTITASITEKYNGAVRLEAEKNTDRARRLDLLSLLPPDADSNVVHTRPRDEGYLAVWESDNRLLVRQKYRLRGCTFNAAGADSCRIPLSVRLGERNEPETGGGFVVEFQTVEVTREHLKIDRQFYSNGHFYAQEGWSLKRD